MSILPKHGRIDCNRCFATDTKIRFDATKRSEDGWRITANPLAWGNVEPEGILRGSSKGPTQAVSLETTPHDDIAYKSHRAADGRIMRHVGLLSADVPDDRLSMVVSQLISDSAGRFHFGSLIRCAVERIVDSRWLGTGGNMLDAFLATRFGWNVVGNCTERFLQNLPSWTRLVVMFGMGSKLNYVEEAFRLFQAARGGHWTRLNDVSCTDHRIIFVHVEHFGSRGALIPKRLGREDGPRGRWGRQAAETVRQVLGVGRPVFASPGTEGTRSTSASRAFRTDRSADLATMPMRTGVGGDRGWSSRSTLTSGNVRNGHFYIDRASSPFPTNAWGGRNALEAGAKVTILFAGTNERVTTDIDGTKRILRNARGEITRFFRHHELGAGDQVQIKKIGAGEYLVERA